MIWLNIQFDSILYNSTSHTNTDITQLKKDDDYYYVTVIIIPTII